MSRTHIHISRRMKQRLVNAARAGSYDEVFDCLLDGIPVNSTDRFGRTALMWAAIQGDEDILSLLICEKNIMLDQGDIEDCTALALAANHGKDICMQMLLERGADPNTVTGAGLNLLMLAAASGCPPAVQVAIKLNLDVDQKSEFEDTALMFGLGDHTMEIPKILLVSGADVNYKTSAAFTPLMSASLHAPWKTLELLLDYGALINDRDFVGETALIKSSMYNKHSVMAGLIQRGANWNSRTNSGGSALSQVKRPFRRQKRRTLIMLELEYPPQQFLSFV